MKYIITDGNLSGFSILLLIAFGFTSLYGSVSCFDSHFLQKLSFVIGLSAIATAGYAGRSRALGLRPFGSPSWRRAKATYRKSGTNGGEEDGRTGVGSDDSKSH